MNNLTSMLVSAVTSGAFFSFLIFLIQRKDTKNDVLKEIQTQLTEIKKDQLKAERDAVRTQLMLLMTDFPDNVSDIMRCGQHYFADLHGNWFATSLFTAWMSDHDIEMPDWFRRGENNERAF